MDIPGSLRVHIIEGRNLDAKDHSKISGTATSDPYFRVGLAGPDNKLLKNPKPYTSKVVKKTLNPRWVETAWVVGLPKYEAHSLRIEVYDHDMIGRDHELKVVLIPLGSIATDAKNFHQVTREFSTLTEAKEKYDYVVPTICTGGGTLKIMVEFKGSLWEKARVEEMEKLISTVDDEKMNWDLVKKCADAFLSTSDARSGYSIKSKEQLESFLQKSGLLTTVLTFDALTTDNAMSLTPEKISLRKSQQESEEWRRHKLDFMWAMCDVDGSGSVSFQEVLMIIALKTNSNPIQRGELAFKLLDKDGSGTLDRSELLKLQDLYYRSFKILFLRKLKDKIKETSVNKKVHLGARAHNLEDKIRKVLDSADIPARLTDKVIGLADKDNSGDVSKKEFLDFLNDKENQQALLDTLHALLAEVGEQSSDSAVPNLLGEKGTYGMGFY